MATKKELTTTKKNALAVHDYGEDTGAGYEGTTSQDYAIPFISVLQALSPQVADKTVVGAIAGSIINTVTDEVWTADEGVAFVPAMRDHCFVEWIPDRGGFVARHGLDSEIVNGAKASGEFGKYKTPDGNDLVDTMYLYGVLITDDGPSMAVVAFKSTGIKKYRVLMTKARAVQIKLPDGRRVNPPLFAHRFRFKTTPEKNKKGQGYFNWDIQWDGVNAAACRLAPDDEVYLLAKACRDLVVSGAAGADYQRQESATGKNDLDDDIPF